MRFRAFLFALLFLPLGARAQGGGGQLRFCLHSDPKTFDPVLVDDDASERVRYMTGGFLMRINRLTQDLEPELATFWKLSKDGRTISFQLREGIYSRMERRSPPRTWPTLCNGSWTRTCIRRRATPFARAMASY